MTTKPLVAVVGRTNVGKSTLVNRLLGRREAIEHPTPGVTRDRQAYEVEWGRRDFRVVDTGGWEPRARGLAAKVVEQAERATREAAVVVFVVDATTGITGDDLVVARSLRRAKVPVMLVANKVDSAAQESGLGELLRLGLGPAMPVSALHGRTSGDLLDAIVAELPEVAGEEEDTPTRIAIVGRPNAGKSSLLNRLVGDERSIVDAEPGTTRDTVDAVVEIRGRPWLFVDTAGIRRKSKKATGPEYYGVIRSLRAIDRADAVILVVDAAQGPAEQDQRIAERVVDAGRAAVLVLNKWDLVDDDRRREIEREIEDAFPFLRWVEIVRTSALTKRGVMKVMPAVERALHTWATRVPTAALNAWLREAVDRIPLSSRGTRPARVRYATQASTRPPHIVVFASARISDGAVRALENSFRDRFGFDGTPIRISVRVRASSRT